MALHLYRHTFVNGTAPVQIILRSGNTPCLGKNKAFTALEETLKASPSLPKNGWRLLKQEDVTYLMPTI